MTMSAIHWLIALLSAAIAYLAIFLIVSLSWVYFGGDAVEALKYRNILSSAFSVWIAATVAPKLHWRRAAYTVSAFLITVESYGCISGALKGALETLDIMNAFFTVFGCVGTIYLLRHSRKH